MKTVLRSDPAVVEFPTELLIVSTDEAEIPGTCPVRSLHEASHADIRVFAGISESPPLSLSPAYERKLSMRRFNLFPLRSSDRDHWR